jgi:hypothetical protein
MASRNEVPVPALDLFSLKPSQDSVEEVIASEHLPIVTLENSPRRVEFEISCADNEYLILSDLKIFVQLGVECSKAGGNMALTDWNAIAPPNLALHSLFQQVDMQINNKTITSNTPYYNYEAWIKVLTGVGAGVKEGVLTRAGYERNVSNEDEISATRSAWCRGGDASKAGSNMQFSGKLLLDMCMQPKVLLGGSTVRLIFTPTSDEKFFMVTDAAVTAQVKPHFTFKQFIVLAKRMRVNPLVRHAHLTALTHTPARYDHTRTEIKTFNIASAVGSISIDNIVSGVLPKRVFVALVQHTAFTGNFTQNALKFLYQNLTTIQMNAGGQMIPALPLTFVEKRLPYTELFPSTPYNQYDGNGPTMTRDEFPKGNVLYVFNIAPEQCEGFVTKPRIGSLALKATFSKETSFTMTAIVFCEYDGLIEIFGDGTVTKNFL